MELEIAKLLRGVGCHLHNTQHSGIQAWERHRVCISAMQNTEERFKAGPGKWFALFTDGRPDYRMAEIVFEHGWSQVEKITGLILSLLGKHSDQWDIVEEGRGGGF